MKLTFLGAAHEVTGSRFLLEACGKRVMIDYGMEQGVDVYENAPLPVAAEMIDYVLLTHAHIDHSGYLPLLYKQGFRGAVYSTGATVDLCGIMLLDCAYIQETEAEWKNRKALRGGRNMVEPLYTQEDALGVHGLFRACRCKELVSVCEGIGIRFIDVGHLLGSASIEVFVTEGGQTEKLVFSGDIGNLNQPFLKDPEYIAEADYVVMESTYGDRSHDQAGHPIDKLAAVLQKTFDQGGNVVIPSFAVGRTQEMLYFIRQIKQDGLVKGHGNFPVYLDSPLAIESTQIFTENTLEYADADTLALVRKGINPISFDGLKLTVSAEESKLINDNKTPKVILSASGMCDAGRIRHHLKHNLWRPECTVLFVGYQSVGTLGRSLVEGVTEVKIFGEAIEVRASIEQLPCVSGHADNNGLMKWVEAFTKKPKQVFVLHGEDTVCELFAARLRDELGLNASAPYNGESWDLTAGVMLWEGNKVKLKKPSHEMAADAGYQPSRGGQRPVGPEAGGAYEQLVAATERLTAMVGRMQNRGRKDWLKLTAQIHSLLKRFEGDGKGRPEPKTRKGGAHFPKGRR